MGRDGEGKCFVRGKEGLMSYSFGCWIILRNKDISYLIDDRNV